MKEVSETCILKFGSAMPSLELGDISMNFYHVSMSSGWVFE